MKNPNSIAILSCLLLAVLGARTACAQISVPQVQLPSLPVQTPSLERPLERTLDTAQNLRRLRVRDLLRTQRKVVDSDPRGEPIVRSEVLAISPNEAALAKAHSLGFAVVRTRVLEEIGLSIVVLRAPEGMSTRRALKTLQQADPAGSYDFNHLYLETGEVAASRASSQNPPAAIATNLKVGLIDGGVDRSHPVFATTQVHEHGCDQPHPTVHGTAVGSLLAGHSAQFEGAAPNAQLYAADVYCGEATGGAVDAIANAFGWLIRERVAVINVSLVGPANRILEQVVHLAIERGHLVVAAVGNDGPSAPVLYPAGYPGVIGVTGVDARHHVLVEACRGEHVQFAALGVDLSAATLDHSYAPVRGTSFAAPLIAGMLARMVHEPDRAKAESAVLTLTSKAVDLGPRGRDKIYGHGFIDVPIRFENRDK